MKGSSLGLIIALLSPLMGGGRRDVFTWTAEAEKPADVGDEIIMSMPTLDNTTKKSTIASPTSPSKAPTLTPTNQPTTTSSPSLSNSPTTPTTVKKISFVAFGDSK